MPGRRRGSFGYVKYFVQREIHREAENQDKEYVYNDAPARAQAAIVVKNCVQRRASQLSGRGRCVVRRFIRGLVRVVRRVLVGHKMSASLAQFPGGVQDCLARNGRGGSAEDVKGIGGLKKYNEAEIFALPGRIEVDGGFDFIGTGPVAFRIVNAR